MNGCAGSVRRPGRRGRRRRAFTLIEILIAALMMSVAILSLMWMTSAANRQSMDAYYEFLAMQAALEPIEVFRAYGYEWLSTYNTHALEDYPLGVAELRDRPFGGVQRPAEYQFFQREITLTPQTHGAYKAIRVSVRVGPKGQNRVQRWLTRGDVGVDALIWDKPR